MASILAMLRALLVLATVLWPSALMAPLGESGSSAMAAMADGPSCEGCAAPHDRAVSCVVPCTAALVGILPVAALPRAPRPAEFVLPTGTLHAGRSVSPDPQPPRAARLPSRAATPA